MRATYLLGPVLGLVLRLRGITCLHASAIDLGRPGHCHCRAPRSRQIHDGRDFSRKVAIGVLSDDVVALADQGTAFPGATRVSASRLWPES